MKYEYKCEDCGNTEIIDVPIGENPKYIPCDKCKIEDCSTPMERVWNSPFVKWKCSKPTAPRGDAERKRAELDHYKKDLQKVRYE